MATYSNNNYKSQFCHHYFKKLKQFIQECDISNGKDATGRDFHFLLGAWDYYVNSNKTIDDIERYKAKMKRFCTWYPTKKGKDIIPIVIEDKDVMLAIEEFYFICLNAKLVSERDALFDLLLNPDQNPDTKIIIGDFVFKAILKHFGVLDKDNKSDFSTMTLGTQINCFEEFIKKANGNDCINYDLYINKFACNAVPLLLACRNMHEHQDKNDTPKVIYDSEQRHLYVQFILFMYISVTCLLRKIWDERKNISNYKPTKAYEDFVMPEERVTVEIRTEYSSQVITKCAYKENLNNARINDVEIKEPKDILTFSMNIRRYTPYKITAIYDNGRERNFPLTMTHMDWGLKLIIILPSTSKFMPVDISALDKDTVEQIIKLIKESGDNQKGINKDISDKLDHILIDNKENLNKLTGLQKQSDEYKILSTKLNNEILKEIVLLRTDLLRKFGELRSDMADEFSKLGTNITELREEIKNNNSLNPIDLQNVIQYLDQINQEKQDRESKKQKRSRQYKKLLGYIMTLVFLMAIGGLIYGYIHRIDYTLLYLTNQNFFKIVTGIIMSMFLYYLYMERKRLLNKTLKICDLYAVGFVVLIVASYFIPKNLSSSDFVESYSFFEYNGSDNAKVAEFMENYLSQNPNNDETTRMQLVTFYVNNGILDKALNVAQPMRDVSRYKKGAAYAAEAYFKSELFSEVWDIIQDYRDIYNEIPALAYEQEAIMTLYGLGCTKDVRKGESMLYQLAKAGSSWAKYHLGKYYSTDMTDWTNYTNKNNNYDLSEYDLPKALCYYKSSESTIPSAAISIGKIYADVNMIDSAEYYYNRAISRLSDGSLRLEAIYRMGLLQEKKDAKVYKKYMNAAKRGGYIPAHLHSALKDKDYKAAIERYKQLGKYDGYRYIPPVVFCYLAIGDTINVLKELNESHPEGKFDVNFIRGMGDMLDSSKVAKDPNYGLNWMKLSADQGCLYAEMICVFKELQKSTNKGEQGNPYLWKKLHEIANTIPFGFVLFSWLEENTQNYLVAALEAAKALSKGQHPAGSLILSSIYLHYRHKLFQNSEKEENMVETSLFYNLSQESMRIVRDSMKLSCIFAGYKLGMDRDRIINKGIIPEYKIKFWVDVANANKFTDLKCYIAHNFTSEISRSVVLRELTESIIEDLNNKPDSSNIRSFEYILMKQDKSFADSLCNQHKDNIVCKKYLNQDIHFNEGENIEFPIRTISNKYKMNNEQLLKELSCEIPNYE